MRPVILALALIPPSAGLAQTEPPEAPTGSIQTAAPAAMDAEAYVELIKRVQIALHLHGFDPGPVNGLDEGRTQAALAQFQLSRSLPVSGSLDEQTLKGLGVARHVPEEEENASAGAGMPLARP